MVLKTDGKGSVEMNAYYQIKLRLTGRFLQVVKGDKNAAGESILHELKNKDLLRLLINLFGSWFI
jgi:hypothetical protein